MLVTCRHFVASKAEVGKQQFTIKHFACDVQYLTSGFVEKNRNDIAAEIQACLDDSSNALVQEVGFLAAGGVAGTGAGAVGATTPLGKSRAIGGSAFSFASPPARLQAFATPGKQGELPFGSPKTPSRGVARAQSLKRKRPGAALKKMSTISSQFSKELQELIERIRKTRLAVLCIHSIYII